MYPVRGSVLLLLLTIVAVVSVVDAGTPCPAREDIYPCMCSSIQQTKKTIYTLVNCRHLASTESLKSIFRELRRMQIDKFIIYDSFWETSKLGDSADENQRLPENWITLLKIKELEIVDSHLSPLFACDATSSCINNVATHVSIVNSTNYENISTICSMGNRKFSWIACMSRLQNFYFVNNRINEVHNDLFPKVMKELRLLNLSHNQIRKIGASAFQNLPKMESLDLSHNSIQSIPQEMFGTAVTSIKFLDISFNHIKSLPSDIFSLTPDLRTFLASNNYISKLPEKDWNGISKEIRTIDLSENPIECDCHMIWMNTTFAVHVAILGSCEAEEYVSSPLRRVSRFMAERCEDGIIKTRNVTKSSNVRLGSIYQDFLKADSKYNEYFSELDRTKN